MGNGGDLSDAVAVRKKEEERDRVEGRDGQEHHVLQEGSGRIQVLYLLL
jgi:hypothetical protein